MTFYDLLDLDPANYAVTGLTAKLRLRLRLAVQRAGALRHDPHRALGPTGREALDRGTGDLIV
jgi:hypothetical protein